MSQGGRGGGWGSRVYAHDRQRVYTHIDAHYILADEYGYLVCNAPANGSCNLVNCYYSWAQERECALGTAYFGAQGPLNLYYNCYCPRHKNPRISAAGREKNNSELVDKPVRCSLLRSLQKHGC